MPNNLVSIVIPLFNKEKYILECLRSVSQQDYTNWECIVIDDGSTDQSVAIVDRYIATVAGSWRVLTKQNQGPSSARNLGLSVANGKFVAFLDADDIWFPNKLSKQVEYMEMNPDCDLTITNYVIFSTTRKPRLKGVRGSNIARLLQRWLDMRGFGGLIESTGLINRAAYPNGLFFKEDLGSGEGLDFLLRWNFHTNISLIPEFLTLYRISEGQLHKDEALILKNSSRLAREFSLNQVEFERIILRQAAYFELSAIRNLSKFRIILVLMKKFMTFDFAFMSLTFAIARRNARARIIFRKERSLIKEVRRNVSVEVVKLSP